MRRFYFIIMALLLHGLTFAQTNARGLVIFGSIPSVESANQYKIQVGAFRDPQNAAVAFEQLRSVSLNPVYEPYLGYTRVLVQGISATDVPATLETLRTLGFTELWIKVDVEQPRIITATPPPASVTEVGFRTIRVGETRSVADLSSNRRVNQWQSGAPSALRLIPREKSEA